MCTSIAGEQLLACIFYRPALKSFGFWFFLGWYTATRSGEVRRYPLALTRINITSIYILDRVFLSFIDWISFSYGFYSGVQPRPHVLQRTAGPIAFAVDAFR